MRTGPVLRLLAIMFGFAVSMAGPALAVSHGYAHSEAAEHSSRHHGAAPAHDAPAVAPDDHDTDHAHPGLDPTTFSRVLWSVPAVVSPAITMVDGAELHRSSAAVPLPDESPPDDAGRTPAQSRAPPAL